MGHHNRHFAGDKYASLGKWGAPTSTANFCEEDYALTLYIAEFINTVSNLAYIYFAVRYPGLPRPAAAAASNGNPQCSSAAAAAPVISWKRPDFLAAALWVLGALSFVFHATLKHSTQYGDEIAMLVLGGALLQGLWPRSTTAMVVAGATVVGSSAVYLKTGQILHHVFAFNTMIFVVGIRTGHLVFFCRPRADRSRYLAQFARAVAVLIAGYTIWYIDLEKCSELRSLRHTVGLPLAWLFEFHGWWHVLTALGASLYIRLIRSLNL